MAYVYAHKRLDNGTIFYIGKGTGNRKDNIRDRNVFWKRTFNKAGGRIVEVIVDNVTDEEAAVIEAFWINIYGLRTDGGVLTNLQKEEYTLGYHKHSESTKKKMSLAQKRVKRNKTDIKRATSNLIKYNKEHETWNKGKPWSNEMKKTLSIAHQEFIYEQLDKDGKVIITGVSLPDMVNKTKVPKTSLVRLIKNGNMRDGYSYYRKRIN